MNDMRRWVRARSPAHRESYIISAPSIPSRSCEGGTTLLHRLFQRVEAVGAPSALRECCGRVFISGYSRDKDQDTPFVSERCQVFARITVRGRRGNHRANERRGRGRRRFYVASTRHCGAPLLTRTSTWKMTTRQCIASSLYKNFQSNQGISTSEPDSRVSHVASQKSRAGEGQDVDVSC
jgi:hypothetical protein